LTLLNHKVAHLNSPYHKTPPTPSHGIFVYEIRRVEMNWTGGKLQRSKQANKGIVQIQKAHFARARARTQLPDNSHGLTSPFHLRSFGDDEAELGGQLASFTYRSVRHTGHNGTLQQRRDRTASAPSQHGSPRQAHETTQTSPHRFTMQNSKAIYESRQPSGESARYSSPMRMLTDSQRRRFKKEEKGGRR
jgi:hypothetical protein